MDKRSIWPAASYRRLERRIILAAACFGLALAAIQGIQSWFGYRYAVRAAESRAFNLMYILSAHLRESVAALDASLVQIGIASERLGGPSQSPEQWRAVLTGALAGMTNTGSLSVTDSNGVIRQSTIPRIVGQSRSNLYMFQLLRLHPDSGLVADKPFRGQVSTGEMLIPLGRRLESPDGAFQGIVVATLRAPQLRRFYRSIDVGRHGSIRILHTEGKILFREPSAQNPIDAPAVTDPVLLAYYEGKQSGLISESAEDGRRKITAFRALPSPGMLVAVSLDRDAELAAWRERTALDASLLAAEIAALMAATALMVRLLRAHQSAGLRLARRERQLLLAESIANMGAVTFDLEAGVARVSPNIATMFGSPDAAEELGMDMFLAAIHEDDRPLIDKAVAACHEGHGPYQQEFRVLRPDGIERIIRSEGFLDAGSALDQRGVVAVCQDITEQRLAERQLVQSQKMEGLGQLTGGVAHDFNNLLTVISLNLEALSEMPDMNSEEREMVEAAMLAADRGADLVRSLLSFARKQPLKPRAIDVNGIVRDTDHLLQRTLGEQISLETILKPDIWPVFVDPAQLQTALVNLAVNARDAMGAGKLTIETGNTFLDERYAEQHTEVTPGPYVLLAISDTGAGIAPELLERVFEPFFTTKEVGKGTGLGLSMVYGFIKQSNGHIKIYSEVGHGTTVKLYLPRSDAATDEATLPELAAVERPKGETILIVEDDTLVREFISRHLERQGYRVFTASSGEEALDLIEGAQQIDLMITDVILRGGMNGRQLADQAGRLRPGLRAIYMSGYTENAIVHHGRLDPGVILLAKPFRAAELDRKVRSALDDGLLDS